MIDSIQAGIAGLKPAAKLLTMRPDPEFRKTFIPTYKGDSKYGSIMDDYYQSEMFDRDAYFNVSPIQPTISLMNPLFGSMGPGSMGQMGNFNDFLKSEYEQMLSNAPARIKRSQEYMDKFNLYGEAYDKMGFGNPQPTLAPGTAALNPIPQDPGAIQKLLGPDGNPMIPFPGDTSPVGGPKIPDMSLPIAGPGTLQPYVPPLPDFYKGFGEDDKTGIMYNDTFYRAADPRRTTMDMSPLDGLISSDPEFAARFRQGEFDFVKDPGNPAFGPAGPMPNTPGVDYDAQANPFASTGQEGVMPELDNIGLITNAPGYNPVTPQQPTGGFDSKAFANELLTGIGDLFKQHFPESAQMAFNNSNQMQSQIEQPIQDATTFDVQPQQNMAFNPFSVNTLGGSFGGGY